MRAMIAVVAFVLVLGSSLGADTIVAGDAKKDIASKWLATVFTGEAAKAMELSDVPFSWDRKQVIQKRDDLEKMYQQVGEKKGKRPVPEFSIEATDKAPKLDAAIIMKHTAYRAMIGTEHIDIYVSDGGKVIGFSD